MLDINGPIYTFGNLVVTPINENLDLLASAYLRLKREGGLNILFYEGEMRIDNFLRVWGDDSGLTFGCFVRSLEQDTTELAGLGRVAQPVGMGNGSSKAEIGATFFDAYQKREFTVPLCQMMLEWVFDKTPLHAVFGTTPEPNRAMLMFLRGLGFGCLHHPIPNYTTWQGGPTGVYVSWMLRETWQRMSPFTGTLSIRNSRDEEALSFHGRRQRTE
jgi:RimJ/RimL family protein N-acetyltransferase